MSDLQPGRDLDAMVHERVMGGKVEWGAWGDERVEPWTPVEGMSVLEEPVPRYSTDMGAAWKVVEKMREDGCYVCVSKDRGDWSVTFEHATRTAPTAPHAICLAALRASGAIP